jgi:hypothetical protein
VSAGEAKPGLVPVGAFLGLAGQRALGLLELFLGPAQETRAVDLAAVGEDGEVPRPRSMPTWGVTSGRTSAGSVATTKEAKYLPALSLITVTVDGVEGRVRDHFTLTSPTLGRRSLPPGVILHPAFAVNRIAWRVSRLDLKQGGPVVGRLPFRPSKKLRYAASRSLRDC